MILNESQPNEFEKSIYDEDQRTNKILVSSLDDPDFWLFV